MARTPGQFWPPPWPGSDAPPAFDEDTDTPTAQTALASGGLYLSRYTPNAKDDAFPGPALDVKWTKQNWSTTAEAFADNGVLSLKAPISSGDNLRMITQPLASSTSDYDFSVWANLVCSDASAQFCGIGLRESGTGKVQLVFLGRRGSGALYRVGMAHYTNATTFGADDGTSIDLSTYLTLQRSAVLLRVQQEGTTLRYKVSFGFGGDGHTGGGNRGGWWEIGTASRNTNFTTAPDQVCLIVNTSISTTPFANFRLFRDRT